MQVKQRDADAVVGEPRARTVSNKYFGPEKNTLPRVQFQDLLARALREKEIMVQQKISHGRGEL